MSDTTAGLEACPNLTIAGISQFNAVLVRNLPYQSVPVHEAGWSSAVNLALQLQHQPRWTLMRGQCLFVSESEGLAYIFLDGHDEPADCFVVEAGEYEML